MTTPRNWSHRFSTRHLAGLAAGLALSAALLTGCSSDGASTDCGLDACTVTFDRGVNAEVSVLGVDARLVGADGDKVTIEVAGEQLSLSMNQQPAQVGGLYVSLASANDSQVAIRISRNP